MSGYAYVKAWRKKNPEKRAAQSRRHREMDPEKVRERGRSWRSRNPDKVAVQKDRWRSEKRLWIYEYQASRGCVVCGENDFRCLVFHHRDPSEKELSISQAVAALSLARVKKEVEKCEVMCANHHSILHYEEE